MATIGQSIVFKGELTGDEDLEIDGQVDGNVDLANHQITIGANGRLKAEVNAKSIIVIGQITGNLSATERIEVQATGIVQGDVRAPRLNVQEGAVLNGSIDMSGSSASDVKKPATPSASSSTRNDGEPQEVLKSA
ncbi:MAG: cell shape determination protein CcmA [Deltaproteobacteria bacterium]|nr:cell shape determination protein CcmA [Deltaproteobacteria bacterium]